MKALSVYSLLLVASFTAAFVSAQQPGRDKRSEARPAEPTPAPMPTAGKNPSQSDTDSESYGPHTCAVFPIVFYGDATLYQADHFADDNCNPSYLAYLYGTYVYPQICPDCQPYGGGPKDCGVRPFFGLAMPAPADFDHKMASGKPSTYSKKAANPNGATYLSLRDIYGRFCYVKIFTYKLNLMDLEAEVAPDEANFLCTIHFAFECQNPTAIGVDPAEITYIANQDRKSLPDRLSGRTTVYDVTYRYEGGTVNILTFLCGENMLPEQPQAAQAAAE